jgi:uncharacterized MAPEG superfamily protein
MNQLHRQNHVLQQQLIPSVQRLQEQLQGQQRLHQEILAQQQQRAQGSPRAGSPFQLAQFPPHLNMPVQPQVPAVHQSFQNIIGQYQRDRAAMGLHGAQQGIPSPTQTRSQSPSASRSFRQEGIGPNGERWQVTLNQTTTYLPADQTHGFSLGQGPRQSSQVIQGPGVRDIQNVIRAGDLQAAQQNYQTSATPSRSSTPVIASSSSDTHGQPSSGIHPEITASIPAPTVSSRTSTEQLHSTAVPAIAASATSFPVAYILSSPAGPRALIINGSESFFTPRQPGSFHGSSPTALSHLQGQVDATHGIAEIRDRREGRAQRHARRAAAAEAEAVAAAAAAAPVIANPAREQNNVGVQMLPHLWLLVRLVAFVWFFVSGDSSWYRWTAVFGIAIIVFLVNTGILNGIAEDLWSPIRRHLEGLLPLAAPDRPEVPQPRGPPAGAAHAAGGVPPAPSEPDPAAPAGPQAEPNPADAAARLVQQRRQANGSWLMNQFRQVEHGMILFLASLIPGVGERHIIARAAEDNIILEARRAARAAAEAEAEAVEAAARENSNEAQPTEGSEDEVGASVVSQPDEAESAAASRNTDGSGQTALIDV